VKRETRHWLLLAVVVASVASLSATAAPARAPDATISAVRRDLALNPLGRYMSPRGGCTRVSFPGWERYPTMECVYRAASRIPLRVILLNPDVQQLASWYVTACRDAHARYVVQCAQRIDLVTTCQSGAQFPVAGYVDEGKIFTFRDGVTVRMDGLRSTTVPRDAVLRDESIVFHGDPAVAKRYARISSTTRSEFARFIGRSKSDFAGLRWLATVRREYQAAWSSARNRLISARVAAAASVFDRPGWDADFDSFCTNVALCPALQAHPNRCAFNWKEWPD
jgi:hypothetical protein